MSFFIKNLFPLTYRSHYTQEGKQHFTVWKQWFGKIWNHEDYVVSEKVV